jgi:Na+/melibiose symporter-like transporter
MVAWPAIEKLLLSYRIMRKNQLIQIALLIVAIICGYNFIQALISIVIPLLFAFGTDLSDILNLGVRYAVFAVLYCVAFFLLIRYNKPIADYIERQSNAHSTVSEERLSLKIEHANLLFILLITLSLITLIEQVPVILFSIYNYFKSEVGRAGNREDLNFKMAAMKFVLAIVLLFTAKPLSSWIGKQLDSTRPLVDTIGEPEGGN